MAAKFEQWFNDKYGKNQSYGRGVALEAWNAAIKSVEEPFTSYNKQSTPLGCACVNCIHVPCCHCNNGNNFAVK